MDIPLSGFSRVRINTFSYILKNFKSVFPKWEQLSLIGIALMLVLTSATWVWAASQSKGTVPANGGSFVEGIVSNDINSVDLGRLIKSGLTRINEKGEVSPDLASSWKASEDKLDYNLTLVDQVTSYEIADQIKNTPTFLPQSQITPVDLKTIKIHLTEPDSNVLYDLAQPIFAHGPYSVEKKTENEIRLKRNATYHLDKPFIDKFTIRIFPDQQSLQKAADRNKITGAMDLTNNPKNWQFKEASLGKKHFLFINSSKTALKKTKTRESILAGTKPDNIATLEVLEVNGQQEDQEYLAWKKKIQAAGVVLKVRTVSLKDALKDDLPKRNYDVLYILIAEGQTTDPYLLWNSTERSSTGQNFAELANADVDVLTEEYRKESDLKKKEETLGKIKTLVEQEKIAVEYKKLTAKYSYSNRVKGLVLPPTCSSPADRFSQAALWFMNEKKVK
jgi:ABC-type transport system substrate-binding protein